MDVPIEDAPPYSINAPYRLSMIIIRLPGLLERARDLLPQDRDEIAIKRVKDLLADGIEMDEALKLWQFSVGDGWLPQTVGFTQAIPHYLDTAETWIGPIHVYRDIHVASITNKHRACRLLNSMLILDCLNWLGSHRDNLQAQLAQYSYVEQTMIDDICYSIPFHLGWKPDSQSSWNSGYSGKGKLMRLPKRHFHTILT